MNAPSSVRTLANVSFLTAAVNIVQPNLSYPDAVDVNIHLPSSVSEPKGVANDSCCCVSESVIAYSPPGAVMIHFKTSFAWTSASKECNVVVC